MNSRTGYAPTSSFTAGRIAAIVLLAFSCFAAHAAGQAEPPAALSPREMVNLRMVQLAEAGRLPEARQVLRDYVADHAGDGRMLYNLACFDMHLGEPEVALVDLERALNAGYTNFRLIDYDRDLNPLRDDPRFTTMVEDYELRFRDRFHARAVTLPEGYRVEGIALGTEGRATAVIEYLVDGLHIEIAADDPHFRDDQPPWRGGSGVLVNLVLPLSPDDYESRRYFSYGFGGGYGTPIAALVGLHGRVLLEDAGAAKARIKTDDRRVRYAIHLPWSCFAPWAPPLDLEMGLNIFYLTGAEGDEREVFSLMPEEALSFTPNPWRRYVPVYFEDSDRSVPVMRGRLFDRVAEGETLDVELAMWTPTAGRGSCRLRITDAAGRPVAGSATAVHDLDVEGGLHFTDLGLALGDLRPGSWRLSVTVDGPGGFSATDSFAFERFTPGWIRAFNRRIHEVETPEKSIPRYYLFALAQQLNRRHPQDDPLPLTRARDHVEQLVQRCENEGTCLPAEGSFLAGFESDQQTQRSCSLFLPAGHHDLEEPRLLVVLPPAPGTEQQLARELGAAVAESRDLIVLVPQSHGASDLARDATRHTAIVIEWAREVFGAGPVLLAGLGQGADAALATAVARPDLCRRILLATAGLSPEARDTAHAIAGDPSPPKADTPPCTLLSAEGPPVAQIAVWCRTGS